MKITDFNEIEKIRRARIDLTLALLNDGAEYDAEMKASLKTAQAPAAVSRRRKRLKRMLDNLVRSL